MDGFKVVTSSDDDYTFNLNDLTPEKSENSLPFMNGIQGENDQLGDMLKSIGKKQERGEGICSRGTNHFKDFLHGIAGTAESAINFSRSLVNYIKGRKENAASDYSKLLTAFHERHFDLHDLHKFLHHKCDDDCDHEFPADDCHFCTHGCPYCAVMDQVDSDPHKTSSLIHSILTSVSEDENYSKIASHPLVVAYLDMTSKVYNEVAKIVTSPDSMQRLKSFDTAKTRQSAKVYAAKLDDTITHLSGLDVEFSRKLSSYIDANIDDTDVLNNFNKWAMSNIPAVMKETHKALHTCRNLVGIETNCRYC